MLPTRTQIARCTVRLTALAAVAAGLAGCQSVAGTSQYAEVRYMDASPDAPALDVYQNSTLSLYDIGFGSKSSYIPIGAGMYTYSVDVTNTQQQLATVRGSFTPGGQFTVLVGSAATSLQMSILKDQAFAAPPGQTSVRFIDQASRLGAVDIYLVAATSKLSATAPILTGISPGSIPTYFNIPSGIYSLVILPAGTSNGTTMTPNALAGGDSSASTTTTSTIATPTLYTGHQVTYPATSARTILILDQSLSDPGGAQVVTADDYNSPSATN